MSQGFICDRCGAAIFQGEQSKLKLELHTPSGSVGVSPEIAHADLCPPCADAAATIITNRIMTKASNPDVFIDGRAKVKATGVKVKVSDGED